MNHIFFFTKQEQRGLILWSIILALAVFGPRLFEVFQTENAMKIQVVTSVEKDLQQSSTRDEEANSPQLKPNGNINPNNISKQALENLGLSSSVAERWVNFRESLGGYNSIDQLYKIYGLDSGAINTLKPHLQWESEASSPKQSKKKEGTPSSNEKFRKSERKTDSKEEELTKQNIPSNDRNTKPDNSSSSPSPIDLNTASKSALESVGFSSKVAHNIVAYREKAGPYYRKEHLYKIYDIDSQRLEQLMPLLIIDDSRLPLIDMNSASAEDLKKVPGIGPYYSERIIEFRQKLGGFLAKEQLAESADLPRTTLLELFARSEVSSHPIEKIEVNSADVKTLARHPYISWSLARRIVNYRKHHFPLQSLEGMIGLDKETLDRLRPYLSFSTPKDSEVTAKDS